MRKRKIVIGVAIGLVCVLLLAAGLYDIPIKTTPIDMSFDAVKSDNDGNEYGTVPITVQGQISEYLFQKSRLTLKISDFDDLYDISVLRSIEMPPPDKIGFYEFGFYASSTILGEDTFLMYVFFNEDLSKWEFFRVYMIGSNKEYDKGDMSELEFAYRFGFK